MIMRRRKRKKKKQKENSTLVLFLGKKKRECGGQGITHSSRLFLAIEWELDDAPKTPYNKKERVPRCHVMIRKSWCFRKRKSEKKMRGRPQGKRSQDERVLELVKEEEEGGRRRYVVCDVWSFLAPFQSIDKDKIG